MTLITQDQSMAIEYRPEDIRLMRETICKGGSEADFRMFLMICQRTRLDPFAKQIYAVMRWDRNLNRNIMTVQTSIDGLRLVAERTGKYAPGRATIYEYDAQGKLRSATAFVKKQTLDGTWHEISYTAFFNEYCQKKKDGSPTQFWEQMGHVMLAKVAEAACLRRCFPMELSGLYTKDEMDQAEVIDPQEEKSEESPENLAMKVQQLLGHFPEEDQPIVREYLDKWCAAHMKTVSEALIRFADIKELKTQVDNWKDKKK